MEPVDYPMVIRLDKAALDSLTAPKISRKNHVDKNVLGTHAVGECTTHGSVAVFLVPDRVEASFDLKFTGHTLARTVGTNGPALIYSRARTDFICSRPVTFDPIQGFVAGESKITADTHLFFDGFDSSRRVLGRRLISRLAEKRSAESQEAARAIAAQDSEQAVRAAFDEHINGQLTELNAKMDIAVFKNLFFGQDSAVQLAARSTKDCIQIGMGQVGGPTQLTTTLPARTSSAPIEIWIHSSIIGEQANKRLLQIQNLKVLPAAARLEALQALLIPATASDKLVDFAVQEGWIVFGLQHATDGLIPPAATSQPIAKATQ